jgi:outer membrane protein OmpA-like peptidoglycan-associated protein
VRTFKIISLLCLVLLIPIGISFAETDVEGSKDPPLFNRMPGYYIEGYEDFEFNSLEFMVDEEKEVLIEGRHYLLSYHIKENSKVASPTQILRNYSNAIKVEGGQEVFNNSYVDEVTLKITKNNIETWVKVTVFNGGEDYTVNIVEKEAMKQHIVANATSLANSIRNSGKVAVYGIFFDTGKSEIKPQSEEALKEIAKLLQTNPQLKLYVVGHTDNVGNIEYNMKLSMERANAVVKTLISKHSIVASRLQAFGVGPLTPVASNKTEEGRALNRRVELVEQ